MRAPHPCLGCATVGRWDDSRCPQCHSQHRRKYGPSHRAERLRWLPAVARGTVACTRCGLPIPAGAQWDLDHRVDGSFPAHARCNRAAGGSR